MSVETTCCGAEVRSWDVQLPTPQRRTRCTSCAQVVVLEWEGEHHETGEPSEIWTPGMGGQA